MLIKISKAILAVKAWIKAQFGIYNVKDYGAVGDGVTNDATAIQAAVNALGSLRGVVFIPAGDYKLTATLAVPENVSLLGVGGGSRLLPVGITGAAIKWTGTHTGTALPSTISDTTSNYGYCPSIKNIQIKGVKDGSGGIEVTKLLKPQIEDVYIRECDYGVKVSERLRDMTISNCDLSNNVTAGVWYDNADFHQCLINNCNISYNGVGINMVGGQIRNTAISNCLIEYNAKGVFLDVSVSGEIREITITGNQFNSTNEASETGIQIKGKTEEINNVGIVSIVGNVIGPAINCVIIEDATDVVLSNNVYVSLGAYSRSIAVRRSKNISITQPNTVQNTKYFTDGNGPGNILINGCDSVILDGWMSIGDRGNTYGPIDVMNSYRVTITNCHIIDPMYTGIGLRGSYLCKVSNCMIFDTKATKTMLYAISEYGEISTPSPATAASDKNVIENNMMNAGISGGVLKTGAHSIERNNDIFVLS